MKIGSEITCLHEDSEITPGGCFVSAGRVTQAGATLVGPFIRFLSYKHFFPLPGTRWLSLVPKDVTCTGVTKLLYKRSVKLSRRRITLLHINGALVAKNN